MFQYTSIRKGDGVPVVYDYTCSLDDISHKLTPEARYDMAFQMLRVIIRERDAVRAEYSDGAFRITLEREGVKHAYNSEPTAYDQARDLVAEALKSDTLTPYVESRLRRASAIMNGTSSEDLDAIDERTYTSPSFLSEAHG